MPKKDLQSSWGLLADLLRETSPLIRWSIALGLSAAVFVMVLLIGSGYFVPGPRGFSIRIMVLVILGLIFAGGFLGLLLGVLLDSLVSVLFPGKNRRNKGNQKSTGTES